MSHSIIKELSGKNYFLSSNSGDLYIVPAEFIRDYTEDEEKTASEKIIVFDAENIYEIPCEVLSDYRLSDEEKKNFQEKILSIKPVDMEEGLLHKGRLILFEYILSGHREIYDVHGYGIIRSRDEELEKAKENQKILREGYTFSDISSDIYKNIQRWF